MRNVLLVALLLIAAPLGTLAQGPNHTAGGCGPSNTQFNVTTSKNPPSSKMPDNGKALVYVIQTVWQQTNAIGSQKPITRVGVDGAWVGANHGESYLIFAVDPGAHSICTDWQSSISMRADLASAADLNAAAGSTYYFQVKVRDPAYDKDNHGAVKIEEIDGSEARLLLGSSEYATSRPKK